MAPEFAAACREATGGNPFFLEELLREIDEQGLSPDAARGGACSRDRSRRPWRTPCCCASPSGAAATALVRAVAVVGDGASLAEAALLAELAADEAAGAADVLIALGILRSAEGLEFTHPIVREAVCAGIGAHERSQAHARAARILADAGASDERVAAQIVGAEPAGDPERVELLRRVAADALCRGAPAAAVAWLAGRCGATLRNGHGACAPRARLCGAPHRGARGGRAPRRSGRADR